MLSFMSKYFIYPYAAILGMLLSVAALAFLVGRLVVARRASHGLPRVVPRWPFSSLVLRLLVLGLLLLTAARPYKTEQRAAGPHVLFLVDNSLSTDGVRLRVEDYIRRRLPSDLGPNGHFAIIGFAGSPEWLVPWSKVSDLKNPNLPVPWDNFVGRRDFTDIERALRMALNHLPTHDTPEGKPTLILLTDGNENYGSALQAASVLRAAEINFEVVPLPIQERPEIALSRLMLPESMRLGEPFSPVLTAYSSNPGVTAVSLRLFRDGDLIWEAANLDLHAGKNLLKVPGRSQLEKPGYHLYEAEIQPLHNEADHFAQNNKAGAVIKLEDIPNLYIVESEPGASRALVEGAWKERLSRMNRQIGTELPSSVSDLMNYDGIVLYDVPAQKLAPAAQQALAHYVEDFGGGLIVLGGPNSLDYGAYRGTRLEEILPVTVEEPKDEGAPTGILIFVIDFSGSMRRILDLVKLSACQTIDAMPDGVTIEVMAFDSAPQPLINPVVLSRTTRDQIKDTINRLTSRGGTDLRPALKLALEHSKDHLRKTGRRDLWARILVYSDGDFSFDPAEYRQILDAYKDDRIQVNCMGIGPMRSFTLPEIARFGRGKYDHFESRQQTTPFFVFQDPKQQADKKVYYPFWTGNEPMLAGFPSGQALAFSLTEYNRTVLRPEGVLSLYIKDDKGREDPLLAWRHLGLGRVAAFACDAAGAWSKGLLESEYYKKLFLQMLTFIRRGAAYHYTRIEAQPDQNNSGQVLLQVRTDATEPGPFTATIFFKRTPAGAEQRRTVRLSPVEPGLFQGRWPAKEDLWSLQGLYPVVLKKEAARNLGAPRPATSETLYAEGKIYIGAADAYVELSRLEPNYNLLSQLARQAQGRLLEIDHAPRRFPDVVRTERKELLAPPGSYLWGALLISLLFLDIGSRSKKLQRLIHRAKMKDEG
jgi:uncharacterized membrane protein/uncharacterized protein YegL